MRLSLLAVPILYASALGAQDVSQAGTSSVLLMKSQSAGFFLAGGLNGAALRGEESDSETQSGGGLGITLGYGFSPRLSAFVEGNSAKINGDAGDYALAHLDIGLRWSFANRARALVPFLEAALTGRAAVWDNFTVCTPTCSTFEFEMSGSSFSFGGGLNYFFNPKVALTTHLKWSVGDFDTFKVDGDKFDSDPEGATTSRFFLGVAWFPRN